MSIYTYLNRRSPEEEAKRLITELRKLAQSVNEYLKVCSENERTRFLAALAEELGGTREVDDVIKSLFEVLDYVLRRGE